MDRPSKQEASAPHRRRIGERHAIPVAIEWMPTPLSRWRRRAKPFAVMTENLSLSGAGFESKTEPAVQMGSMVTVTIGEVTGQGVVRMLQPDVRPGYSYYGIEFRDTQLLDVVRDLISAEIKASDARREAASSPLDRTSPRSPGSDSWP